MTYKKQNTVSVTNGLAEVNKTRLYYEAIGERRSLISAIADLLEEGMAGARKVVVSEAVHLVNMEQPKEFNRLVLDFLSGS